LNSLDLSSLICGPILYYLFKPSTKAWFNKTIAAKRLMDTENSDESVEIRPQHRD